MAEDSPKVVLVGVGEALQAQIDAIGYETVEADGAEATDVIADADLVVAALDVGRDGYEPALIKGKGVRMINAPIPPQMMRLLEAGARAQKQSLYQREGRILLPNEATEQPKVSPTFTINLQDAVLAKLHPDPPPLLDHVALWCLGFALAYGVPTFAWSTLPDPPSLCSFCAPSEDILLQALQLFHPVALEPLTEEYAEVMATLKAQEMWPNGDTTAAARTETDEEADPETAS